MVAVIDQRAVATDEVVTVEAVELHRFAVRGARDLRGDERTVDSLGTHDGRQILAIQPQRAKSSQRRVYSCQLFLTS